MSFNSKSIFDPRSQCPPPGALALKPLECNRLTWGGGRDLHDAHDLRPVDAAAEQVQRAEQRARQQRARLARDRRGGRRHAEREHEAGGAVPRERAGEAEQRGAERRDAAELDEQLA